MSLASRRARMALRTPLLVVTLFGAATAQAAVNPADPQSVRDGYASMVLAGEGVATGWNGSTADCTAGNESPTSAAATIAAVNYFREMNRLTPVSLAGAAVNAKAQAAALMFEASNNISHTPDSSWTCYTAGGAEAAGRSNIALGIAGARTVSAYVEDTGSYNEAVGHRRWILYPRARVFGTGSTTRANALWVVSDTEGTRPAQDVVAWPPQGYVPWPLVYQRWSVSTNLAPYADYSAARVSVSIDGVKLPVRQLPVHSGYADNTLAFEPSIPAELRSAEQPTAFDVTVSNVVVNGTARTLSYRTTAIPVDTSAAPNDVQVGVEGRIATITWHAPADSSVNVSGYRVTVVDGLGRPVSTNDYPAESSMAVTAELADAHYRADVRTITSDGLTTPGSRMFSVGTPTAVAKPLRAIRVLRSGARSRTVRVSLRTSTRMVTTVLRWNASQGRWLRARRPATRSASAGIVRMRISSLNRGRYRVVVRTPRTAAHLPSRATAGFRIS